MQRTMRAAVVTKYGYNVDEVMEFRTAHPVPQVKKGSKKMLIRVQACSISYGDYRMITGEGSAVKHAPFPYVPGLDVCGFVEEIDPDDSYAHEHFKVGDHIIGTWNAFGVGGFAEYALVNPKYCVAKPESLTPVEAACLPNSGKNALCGAEAANVKKGDRVLVLGGSGGVASMLLQLVKNAEPSFLAATSTDEAMLTSLGVDRAIDYRHENWWEIEEFKSDPFDVVVDLAEGRVGWHRCKREKICKPAKDGGRWVAMVVNEWRIDLKHYYQICYFLCPPLWRILSAKFHTSTVPRYVLNLPGKPQVYNPKVVELVESGKMKIVLDPHSPHPFTLEGTRDACRLQGEKKGHGKIVVKISD